MTELASDPLRDCWFLTGATASGKTAIGVELALRLNAEIASLDSMAIYREMNIGTAKPSDEQRQRVTHHLLDLVDPTEVFSVSEYRQRALQVVTEARERGKQILFVGGTPLYLKALLRGIFDGPEADWEFRRAIEKEIEQYGLETLHERLKLIDPLTAHKLHPHDQRRMIRALEVHHVTGQPISHLQLEFDEPVVYRRRPVFVLHHERSRLHQRIDARVDGMFATGLLGEVQGLLEKYHELGRTASQAVGYRESIEHLRGNVDLAATVSKVKSRTRQFARRQETWFRALEEAKWIELTDETELEPLVGAMLQTGEKIVAGE